MLGLWSWIKRKTYRYRERTPVGADPRFESPAATSDWLRAIKAQAPLMQDPICVAWRKDFEFERDRWLKVPGAVIVSGKPGAKDANVFRVMVHGEVRTTLPLLPDHCSDIDLHLIRGMWG